MSFVHLRVKSGYTFMHSTAKIEPLIQKAKRDGMSAVALTDRNVLYGAIEFYQACKQENIKPIIGMETTVEVQDRLNHVLVLAKNNTGYQALMKISSLLQTAEQPVLTLDQFTEHLSQCFVILPLRSTNLGEYVNNHDQRSMTEFLELWPAESLIGLTHFDLGVMNQLEALAQSTVGIGDVNYLEPEDQTAYSYLRAMDKKGQAEIKAVQGYHHFFTQEEAVMNFNAYPELVDRTITLAAACQVELNFDQQLLPTFPLEDDQTASDYLRNLCQLALTEKYSPSMQNKAQARLDYELSIIDKMGFSDYFLIVWDFVRYAKSEAILVGPGRGSVAGSLVAYLLEITMIDPINYNLLFERFLNPERISMPDIDIDFSDYRRNEVIDYVKEKYGHQSVAQIGTFGTFKTRSTIRELAKVFDLSNEDLQFILNEIPSRGAGSIAQTVKASPALVDYLNQNNHLKEFFRVASLIEGLPRNMSTHAAGIVIQDTKLIDHVPLRSDSEGNVLTQYAMNDLERIGLLKIDFLGLRNLTTIERILALINYHEQIELDLNQIPLDDQATYALFRAGQTNGIFQFESQAMRTVLKRLKPNEFEDIVAVNALYRPGPMDFIDTYIARKHNQETISYIHPDLKPILSSTYGVLVYQEQIIQLAHQFAGMSLGKADILRRAVSKKNREEIERLKQQFISGCSANNYSQAIAEEVFSWITRFADYGFNRSHAVAYSMIAYQLTYLKSHYPVYFITELLNTVIGEQDKIAGYMKEARQRGIELLAPTINASHYYFQPEKGDIRMGLSLVKGLSYPVVNEIIQQRKQGRFKSLFDFCLRVSLKIVNRGAIETLTLAGVFDEFGVERASVLATIDQAIDQGELFGGLGDQESLFGDSLYLEGNYQAVEPFGLLEKLNYEKELLGLYLSDHPLKLNRQKLRANGIMDIRYFYDVNQIKDIPFAAVVQKIRPIRTKRGDSMAFIELADEQTDAEGVVFSDLYREIKPMLEEQMFVLIKGKKEWRHGKEQMIVNELTALDLGELPTDSKQGKRLFIKLGDRQQIDSVLATLEQLVDQYPGSIPIVIYQANINKTYLLAEQYYISDHYRLMTALKQQFGQENVVLQ